MAALLAGAAACADGPQPVLRAGPVEYAEAELGGLTTDQRRDLAVLSAFAHAVAARELDAVLVPLIQADLDAATLRRLTDEIALRRSGLTDAALRAAYDATPEAELVVRHLVVLAPQGALGATAAAARARAVVALNRIRAGEEFAAVAAEVSEEPGAARRGGLLQPGRRGDWVEPFWSAASALQPGEVSDIVRTEYGFHVLRLERRRLLPLEEVRRTVAGRLVPGEQGYLGARAWADSLAKEVRVSDPGLRGWLEGDDPTRPTELAAWPGGALTVAEAHAALARLPRDSARAARSSARGARAFALAEARRRRLLRTAQAMALGPLEEEGERARASWTALGAGWAAALGFAAGADESRVKDAALGALSSRRQGVALARAAVLDRAPAIERVYPVWSASSSAALQPDTSR
ncbi:MAG: peptidylprolyl isomerase [Gemmatimonadota bacterium]